ncbi:MAG TPA: DUF2203 domain-containing protein [Pyrinomonadaceae bacterium]|jgi:hypothetical protein|nr:DUF2203 domain-containing protein [Pyrinomonadaceae bacterium]
MKLFTLSEANAMLPTVRRIAAAISRAHREIVTLQDAARVAAEKATLGGGFMADGARYVTDLISLAEHTSELEALGVQLKDYERGLLDFPSMREGRVVLLCWQLGEGDRIEWWHDLETGFAGRQPI